MVFLNGILFFAGTKVGYYKFLIGEIDFQQNCEVVLQRQI